MDYVRPVESLIPGVRGRVLGALTRTTAELSMRSVAALAGVSVNQANRALHDLIALGIVSRHQAGSAAMVRLERSNEAARVVLALAALDQSVTDRLRASAAMLHPAPVSLVIFGSFARGEASPTSDVDVLAVIPDGPDEYGEWVDTLGAWADEATLIIGNRVNLIVEPAEALAPRNRPGSFLQAIGEEGVVIAGAHLRSLGLSA